MLTVVLAFAALLHDPEGVVTTARPLPTMSTTQGLEAPRVSAPTQEAMTHGLTTDEQIERWIDARAPARTSMFGEAPIQEADRKPRGFVEASIGSRGHHAFGGAVTLPIGDDGEVTLRYHQSRNDHPSWRDLEAFDHPLSPLERRSLWQDFNSSHVAAD